jgi:D-aminopeptidase
MLHSPIGLTNSHSVGVVRDALVAYEVERRGGRSPFWSLPVVGETWDGILNDINGLHVRPEHVRAAIADASSGPVAEGNVGSGTGMICHGFKGGIGTASRRLYEWTVGVLVQANHGQRSQLRVDGAPVGRVITADAVPTPVWQGEGSIIGIVATDAPLLPMQCARLAQRAALGVTRAGGLGEHFSGDMLLCFSTGNRGLPPNVYSSEGASTVAVRMTGNALMNGLFQAAVEATEEAILNTLLAAETMTGRGGATAHGLEPARLTAALAELGRAVQ